MAGTDGINLSVLVLLTTQPDCQDFRAGNTDDEETKHSTVQISHLRINR